MSRNQSRGGALRFRDLVIFFNRFEGKTRIYKSIRDRIQGPDSLASRGVDARRHVCSLSAILQIISRNTRTPS